MSFFFFGIPTISIFLLWSASRLVNLWISLHYKSSSLHYSATAVKETGISEIVLTCLSHRLTQGVCTPWNLLYCVLLCLYLFASSFGAGTLASSSSLYLPHHLHCLWPAGTVISSNAFFDSWLYLILYSSPKHFMDHIFAKLLDFLKRECC